MSPVIAPAPEVAAGNSYLKDTPASFIELINPPILPVDRLPRALDIEVPICSMIRKAYLGGLDERRDQE